MPRRLTLVTHLFPHCDDVAGLWLLQRFDPACADANLMFIPTGSRVKLGPDHVGVGVGRGQYDEHKGDLKDSATSLIWKDLKRRHLLPGGLPGTALARLVDEVRRDDLGLDIGDPRHFRNDTKVLQTVAGLPDYDSITAARWGYTLLDALWKLHVERETAIRAIKKGLKFKTRWGRGVAVMSDVLPGMTSAISAELGFALVVLEHPSRRYLHVRAGPKSRVDLTRLAGTVRALEPDGEWYLHQSRKMLLHGDLVAPTPKKSKFRLADAVRLIKKICA